MRAHGDAIRAVLDELGERQSGALYFPFFFYGGTELRPMQPYLNKLPMQVVHAIPQLAAAAELAATTRPQIGADAPAARLGSSYRPATTHALSDSRDPFSVDPAIVERGLRGHAATQNALAAVLGAAGIDARSPRADEPNFDLAWEGDGAIYVAEVKSITPQNEERQLRLGLGQVLRYRDLLRKKGFDDVRAVLVAELPPHDESWRDLCKDTGVLLVHPPGFSAVLPLELLVQASVSRGHDMRTGRHRRLSVPGMRKQDSDVGWAIRGAAVSRT